MMLVKKRGINPLLVKIGVALALSFAGFFYSRFRRKRTRPSLPPPSSRRSLDHGSEAELGGRFQCKDDIHTLKSTCSSCSVESFANERYEESNLPKVFVDNSMVGLSPSSRHSGDSDGFLLPEFNDLLVNQYDLASPNAGFSSRKDVKMPKAFRSLEKDDYEQEVKQLRNMVRILRERERNLEYQLLEYYGLKEQETAVVELQNRLKINNMEAKFFTLKIESLQADNQRLEGQLADHSKVVAELEVARTKIKLLKKILRSETEKNKEQIVALQKKVAKLQEQEYSAAGTDPDTQSKLQRLKVLEDEVEDLRESNTKLQLENSELAQRLESTQVLANCLLEDPAAEVLKETSDHLKQENETLSKKVEQLQADRCADVEESVYLKWINACLRYELRNYQAPSGKTVARDLSKTLSPKSESKAKQLILQYANTEGVGTAADFDSDRWSLSQTSYITDSENHDDSSTDTPSATKTNTSSKGRFFKKLRKLIRGKDSQQVSSADRTGHHSEDNDSPLPSSNSSMLSNATAEVQSNRVGSQPQRVSWDIQSFRNLKEDDMKQHVESSRRNSDVGSSNRYKKYAIDRESTSDLSLAHLIDQDQDLLKFAGALKDSHSERKLKRTNSASFHFG